MADSLKTPENTPKDKPSRTDQARQVAEEYADDQRAIVARLRKRLPMKSLN